MNQPSVEWFVLGRRSLQSDTRIQSILQTCYAIRVLVQPKCIRPIDLERREMRFRQTKFAPWMSDEDAMTEFRTFVERKRKRNINF